MSQNESKMNRRELLTSATMVGAALPLASMLLSQTAAAKDCSATQKEVDGTNPVAKALKYSSDATKSADRKTDKQGVKAKDQSCSNCQLYKAECGSGAKELGKCTMITAGLVKSGGWCASWAKKA